MAKRILFFTLTYEPFIGGSEVSVKEVTNRISRDEYAFDMITLRFDKKLPRFERVGNIDVFRVGFTKENPHIADFKKFPLVFNKYLYPFISLIRATVLHRRKPYDAVMSTMTSYATFGALFFKLLHPSVPFIIRSDDGDPFDHYRKKTKILGPLFSWIFTKADFAVAVSSYLVGEIRKMGYRGKVVIVPNAVNVKHFSQSYSQEEIEAVKNKLEKKDGDRFLITTSRLVKKNATDDVIKAMKFLPNNIFYLIYGIGPDMDMLKALAKSEGVEDRVRFMGQLPNSEIPKYLKASDIFIRPSLSEGFGISFLEAMAAEIPVIATQEGGISDYLFDSEKNPDKKPTGYAVNARDPQDIARQVKHCLEDNTLRTQIITEAKRMAIEKYDWDLIAKQMKEEVFDAVLLQ